MQKSEGKLKEDSLEQIRADIVKKDICPNLVKTATNLVMGDGNPNAQIVFIGEAPGKNEDLQGKPFVGAAGKLLDEMLGDIDLMRKDVYITNIVKYRPPNNRDPSSEEKEAFWPYLLREIAILQPKIIGTLGRHSMEYFLSGEQITKVHGQPRRIRIKYSTGTDDVRNAPVVILPLYHPAAALYNGSLKQTLIDDFRKIPTIINLIEQEKEIIYE